MEKILILCGIIILLTTAAAEISVIKEAPEYANLGDEIQVNISVTNNLGKAAEITVEEIIGPAIPIEPSPTIYGSLDNITAWRPPAFRWNLIVPSGSSEVLTYKIKPTLSGKYIFSPTIVTLSNGMLYYSNELSIDISPEADGICSSALGENYFINPDDCPSGSEDGVCDEMKDSICDTDCEKYADFDCFCDDGTCDYEYGEDFLSCPTDCTPSSFDNYCTGLSDRICDPDCLSMEDPDCSLPSSQIDSSDEGKSEGMIFIAAIIIVIAVFMIYFFKIKPRRK